ncbi:MAG TPA: hypothetical protein VNO51_05285 [Ilumatobacteraceae bacterium]|nr:hypothetical protein [Ilumatobacteraceae bacterium]
MRRTSGALFAAVVIAAVGVVGQPRAIAQDDSIELALVTQNFAVAPDGLLRLSYEVSGTIPDPAATTPSTTTTPTTAPNPDPTVASSTAAAPDTTAPTTPTVAAELTVLVTALDPITLRSEVSEVLDGGFRTSVDSAEYDLVDVIGPNQNGTTASRRQMTLEVQTATSGEVRSELALPRAGLYPITVAIRQRSRTLATHVTFIERLATPESGAFPRSTLNLSIVAGIPDPGPEPDQLDLVESNARVTELAQLGEVITAPLTVSVPPVVAAALADDPTLAARLQSALTGDEVLARPEALLDPSSAVAANQVETFTRELREGEDTLRRVLPATAVRRVAWLTTEPLSAGGASMLRDLGVQLVVVPFDYYLALESNHSAAIRAGFSDPTLLLAGGLADGGELPLTVVDPIDELLATDRDDDATPTEVAAHLFADLMAMRLQLGPDSRSFLLATPGLGIPDPDVLAVIEAFVGEHPDVGFQTLSFVPGTTGRFLINDEQVRVAFPETAGPDLTNRVHEIDLVRLHMEHVATMLPTDDSRPAGWRTELDSLMSTGIDDTAVTGRLDRVERELRAIEQAIQPPDPFTFTLAGNASTITLRFTNTSTTALHIGVRVSGPSRLAFPQPDTEVTLEPGVITDVTIPIEARSNGTSEVSVEVHTPSGSVIGEPIVLTARVNALSGLGQLLTGAALLVLATWWYSHFRRRRRVHRLRDSQPSRNGHPSNRAADAAPGPAEEETPSATDDASSSPTASPASNGDDVSPDAAVASSSLEQTDG